MDIPKLHPRLWARKVWRLLCLLVAYYLPLLIFASAVTLAVGYNNLFIDLLRDAADTNSLMPKVYEEFNALQAEIFWLNYPATRRFSIAALCVGDTFFALMFVSFLRAVFTSAGHVSPEPWLSPPRADAARQRSLHESWVRQQAWIGEQEAYAQQKAAQTRQLLQLQMQWIGMSEDESMLLSHTALSKFAAVSPHRSERQTTLLNRPDPALSDPPDSSERSKPGLPPDGFTGEGDDMDGQVRPSPSATLQLRTAHPPTPASLSQVTSTGTTNSSAAAVDRSVEVVDPAAPYGRQCIPPTVETVGLNPNTVYEYEADGSLRFCGICRQYKPDGSHHCSRCRRCVDNMDHHCIFLNNCVGRRNYKFFFLCLFYSTLCGTVNSGLFIFAYAGSAVCAGWEAEFSLDPELGWSIEWRWWVPAGMTAIGVCVAYLLVQHVLLLWHGISTLDRMNQLSFERFLARISAAPRPVRTRCALLKGCFSTLRTCVGAVTQAVQLVLVCLPCPGCNRSPPRKLGLPMQMASSTDAAPTQAERRAQRIELLFGKPKHCWEYLLPISPQGGWCKPCGNRGSRAVVEAV
ncbi:hypothetical protein ABB37_02032 [Leptomonas pyrrhocoris]|uniref:Palmitoyltransferase n=1 Tax=Leptomonas pyrrhocoris TaxID=157538 RepID=A0A0N0VGT3_LEPPY|nr:hypothetical protein ABB37_02032 [Leptomonas pyrrhocoris]KPA83824.1 hypothetical protein ABB37_02032 [Leptomonas pyrrhocoris]|eukprot:XP_015662263.1 hypothetical protein ABB37_02032 [Leptomonas pyrrhocoris]